MKTTLLAFALCTGWAALAAPSPAEIRIQAAKAALAADPNSSRAYNDLALALARRARETSNPAYYQQAEDALHRSMELRPDNFEAQKLQVWLALGRHEFARARELARALNKRSPDDIVVYGFLVDANAELGSYKEAEEAAQWMLDMSPGAVAALTRAAYLREIFGDLEGAIELMGQAYSGTPFAEKEDRAWILTQIGHLQAEISNFPAAEKVLTEALELFPDYHYALGALAATREAQRRYAEAADLLRRRYAAAPHPENLYALAEALDRAGRKEEADAAYRRFEAEAGREIDTADNSNHELIAYYLGRGDNPTKGLRVAELEMSRRHDVHTRALYACALHAAGREEEARRQMELVIAIGTRDPKIVAQAHQLNLTY